MAKAISSEELHLKKRARRRLVGAVALVIIVVVFVPMILDNEPQPVSEDIAINISPPAAQQDEDATSSEPLRFTPADETSGDADSENAAPEQEAASAPAVQSKPASTDRDKPAGAAAGQTFVVQLGAFSNADNAARLAKTVRENRFDAYTEVVMTSGGERTRVRVGPYSSRAEAEQARDRLKARKLTYGEPAIMRSTD